MKKAQMICKKHLERRKEEKRKKQESLLARKKEADILFNWVLDLFEDPYECGKYDEIVLCKFGSQNIAVGYLDEGNVAPGKKFDDEVMKILVTMFNKEKGFKAVYQAYHYKDGNARVTIAIK